MWQLMILSGVLLAQDAASDGAARPVPNLNAPGQLQFFDQTSEQWLAPDLFLLHKRAEQEPPRWPARTTLPTDDVNEGDRMRLIVHQGGCDLVYRDGAWVASITDAGYDARLLKFERCESVPTATLVQQTDTATEPNEP